MTFAGAPMIYYGTEAGMDGADDPCDRMPMVWEDLTYEARTLGPFGKLESSYPIKFDSELFNYYRRLINVRRDHPSLRHGSVQYLATNDQTQTIAFSRSIEEETLIVCVNRGQRDAQINLTPKVLAEDDSGRKATRLVPIIASNDDNFPTLEISQSDNLKIQIPALTAAVWRVEY
jgi:glycosidase